MLLLVLASALMPVGVSALVPPSATAGAAPSRTCASLQGKHLIGHGARATVLTRLLNRESERSGLERVAYVCASQHARAWKVGSVSAPSEPPGISLVTGAGEWVVLRFSSVIGEGFSESELAANALTGRHFRFWSASGGMGSLFGSQLEAVQIDAQGRLALILGVAGTPKAEGEQAPIVERKVVGVEANGTRRTLDTAATASIPTSSLKLVGGIVHWSDAGVERSAAP